MRKYETTIRRLLSGVSHDPKTNCWIWTRCKQKGYGKILHDGHAVRTHRFAYEYFKGPIPEDFELDHLCRNIACCNPWHLEPVPHDENIKRSPITPTAINGRKFYCSHGHEFTSQNTYRWKGQRYCRKCRASRERRRRLKGGY